MNDELSMVLKTVVPLAAVALVLAVLYAYLPLWLFFTVLALAVVAAVVLAVNPGARAAVKNALAGPPEDQPGSAVSDKPENK